MATAADTTPIPTTAVGTASPPWIQFVRRTEPEPERETVVTLTANVEIPAESKKSAWNRNPMTNSALINGGIDVESGGSAVVVDADLWPSLSECTKASPKLSSASDSSNIVPDFKSGLSSQVTGIDASSTATASSVRSPLLTAQKPTTSYSNHHLTANHGQPVRQKSMKREGEGNSKANGVFSHQSSQPAGDGTHYHHNQSSPKPSSGGSSESSGRDSVQTHSHRESGQRNAAGEHSHHRNSYRKGSGGPQSRGDGSYQNYGGRRRDQEHGNHDWNHQKSFNGRDASIQPGVVSRGFDRPPPVATPFVHHPHVQPFLNPAMPELPIFYLPHAMHFVAPVPQMYFSAPDAELHSEILKQINYYFSNENLVRDIFLRERMDENGWVSVDVISKFNRVKNLTNDTFQILETIRPSSVVEVQGDKIRKRDDWMRWIMPTPVQLPTGSQSPKGAAVSAVTYSIQSFSLDEKTNDPSMMKGAVAGSSTTLQASSGDSISAPSTIVGETGHGGC